MKVQTKVCKKLLKLEPVTTCSFMFAIIYHTLFLCSSVHIYLMLDYHKHIAIVETVP